MKWAEHGEYSNMRIRELPNRLDNGSAIGGCYRLTKKML